MTDETASPETTTAPNDPPVLPTPQHFLLNAPLYASFPVSDQDGDRRTLTLLRRINFQIDAHCIKCKRDSVFKTGRSLGTGSGMASQDQDWMLKDGDWSVELKCARNFTHKYEYWLQLSDRKLRKIGQWPSLEDIAGADIEKYRKQLKGGYFTELKMATGLASHGVGIGAFVYLRRIFEKLIYQHHDDLPTKIEGFGGMKMDEKIGALKSVLPPALVANKATYAILSRGLHELDENTCKLYFPVVRSAIIRILEQDFQARAAKDAEDALARDIADIARQLKS